MNLFFIIYFELNLENKASYSILHFELNLEARAPFSTLYSEFTIENKFEFCILHSEFSEETRALFSIIYSEFALEAKGLPIRKFSASKVYKHMNSLSTAFFISVDLHQEIILPSYALSYSAKSILSILIHHNISSSYCCAILRSVYLNSASSFLNKLYHCLFLY